MDQHGPPAGRLRGHGATPQLPRRDPTLQVRGHPRAPPGSLGTRHARPGGLASFLCHRPPHQSHPHCLSGMLPYPLPHGAQYLTSTWLYTMSCGQVSRLGGSYQLLRLPHTLAGPLVVSLCSPAVPSLSSRSRSLACCFTHSRRPFARVSRYMGHTSGALITRRRPRRPPPLSMPQLLPPKAASAPLLASLGQPASWSLSGIPWHSPRPAFPSPAAAQRRPPRRAAAHRCRPPPPTRHRPPPPTTPPNAAAKR